MKILVISDLWPPFPGGAERFVFNVARELRARGHEIHVLTSYTARQTFDGIEPVWGNIGVNDLRPMGAKLILDHIHALKPDAILTHHYFAYTFEREIFDLPLPVVQIVHNGRRLPKAAIAVFNSEWTASQKGSARRPEDLVILPPAYPDVIADTHGDCIGFVKPIPHKGVELVYALAKRMPERKFLVLRGEWQTLETIEQIQNVEFLNPVDDVRDFYRRCRIVLMPSLTEDAGTIPQECALNGIPCISTNVQGLNETNGGGIRREPNHVGQWMDAIESLDEPGFYAETVGRQTAHLATFEWPAKFDALDAALRRAKFVSHYENYPAIGRAFLATYPTQQAREQFLLDHASGRILDMGCNDCGLWDRYPERHHVNGVDLSAGAVAAARRKGYGATVGRAEATGQPDKSYDTVAFSELLEHVEDPDVLLREAVRLARVQIIGTVPRPDGGWGAHKFDPDHVRFWTRAELDTLLAKYGAATVTEINGDFLSFVVRLDGAASTPAAAVPGPERKSKVGK